MKATELRIGNWVQTKQTEKQFQVTTSTFEVLSVVESQYKPIPLTEEWLVKFGFKFDGHCSFWKSDIELTKDTGEEYYSVFNTHGNSLNRDGIVEHVHQLQNLYFALTGEELQTDEIKKKSNNKLTKIN